MNKDNKSGAAYSLMLETYKAKQLDSLDKVNSEKQVIKKKALFFSVIIIAITFLLTLVWSNFIVFWFMAAIFSLTWIWMSALYGLRFLNRYSKEEL